MLCAPVESKMVRKISEFSTDQEAGQLPLGLIIAKRKQEKKCGLI